MRTTRDSTAASAASSASTRSTATSARAAATLEDVPNDVVRAILRRRVSSRRNNRYGEWEGLMRLVKFTRERISHAQMPGWPAADLLVVKGDGSTYSVMNPNAQRRTRAHGVFRPRPGRFHQLVFGPFERPTHTRVHLGTLAAPQPFPAALQALTVNVITDRPQRIQAAFGQADSTGVHRYRMAQGEFGPANVPAFLDFIRELTGWR